MRKIVTPLLVNVVCWSLVAVATASVLESWPETDRIMASGYTPGNRG